MLSHKAIESNLRIGTEIETYFDFPDLWYFSKGHTNKIK